MARKGSKDRGLFERPKDSGVWWIRYHDASGQERREKVGSKALARKLYEKRKTEIRERRYFPPERSPALLFDQILDDYRESKNRGPRDTIWGKERYARLMKAFGGKAADSITPADIEAFRDGLHGQLSPATINRHLQLFRAIFGRALRHNKVNSNPLRMVKLFRENNKRERYLSADEEIRLLELLPVWLSPLVIVAMHTGLRRGELLKLCWQHVDFTSGTIAVRAPKSGEDEHVVMNETTKRTLTALWERRLRRLEVLPGPSGFVFTGPRGRQIRNFNPYWYTALRKARIGDFHFHDLRHTFGSRAAMAGVDLYTLQALMRHRTPQMTMRYAHLSPFHLRDAIQRLDHWSADRGVPVSVPVKERTPTDSDELQRRKTRQP
jgi:integrase